MSDLDFQVTGVEAAARGLAPLLHFNLSIRNLAEVETIQSILLHVQIQVRSPQRLYNASEKEKLVELFGTPDRWGQTLRNRLWGVSATTVQGFTGAAEAVLPMPCTFDLNMAATKYFHALEGGEIPLLFLFSGSVFYQTQGGRLQVEPIPWNKECTYDMPLKVWQEMMDHHFPNSAWLSLHRDVFNDLCAYKRSQGFSNWEETISSLLGLGQKMEVAS